MNKYLVFAAIALFLINALSCNNGKSTGRDNISAEVMASSDTTIQILYFHGDRRCPTCISIEKISKDLYNDQFKDNSRVKFFAINIDRDENKAIAEKYQVTGSSLIVSIKGKPNNVTFEAFKYALDEPDSLKLLITEIVKNGIKN
jgi:hypothetical protein